MFQKILSLFRSGPKGLRLRHVLTAGVMMEEKAEEFYRAHAGRMEGVEARALCLTLADEEVRHQRYVRGILSRWQRVSVSPADLRALGAELKIFRMFVPPPPAGASPREILAFAIAAEHGMVRFYSGFKDELRLFLARERAGGRGDPAEEARALWKGVKLGELIEEERSHVRRLEEMLPRR
jgi:rubrerythrin